MSLAYFVLSALILCVISMLEMRTPEQLWLMLTLAFVVALGGAIKLVREEK